MAAALILGLVACADDAVSPGRPGDEPVRGGRTLGLVEVTITGLGTGAERSSVIAARSEAELRVLRARRDASGAGAFEPQGITLPRHADETGDGTIQLELFSTGSFTDGVRGSGGYRYLWATYRVRNAQADGTPYDTPRQNLTFFAVDTESTIGETAVTLLERFDGSAADPALAAQLIPTGAAQRDQATGEIVATTSDVLQLLTEAEADAVEALVDANSAVADVFPYGFVVRRVGEMATRELPANPDADGFDGIVTFAFKVPLQASRADDPFTVSLLFLAVDDDEVKLTQAVEEQTPERRSAFEARAAALGADVLTLLAPSGDVVPQAGAAIRVLCDVRVAGPEGSPSATLSTASEAWLLSSLFRSGSRYLPQNARIAAARCPELVAPGPATFAVHGFQSGRNTAGAYAGAGGPLVLAPGGRGGSYFPGEEVEVTLTTALGRTKPVVARYRVAVTAGSGGFVADTAYGVGREPTSIAVGDLDGDGNLDMVVGNVDSDDISVLLNQGNGIFGTATAYPVDGGPYSIALGDLDGDGDLDVVTGNYTSNSFSVLFNQGDGSFGQLAKYNDGGAPWAVALGDMDGDGDLDLVKGNLVTNQVSVLFNQGDGSFVPGYTYGTGSTPQSLALGDLDGDGDLDVAVANYFSGSVWVFSNQGDGSLVVGGKYVISNGPHAVALGDLDGDGDLDMATANINLGSSVRVHFNLGGGTFGSPVTYPVSGTPRPIALGDLDGDGDLDIVTARSGPDEVLVFLNGGDGTLAPHATYAVGRWIYSVALGDVDGDGDLDLAVPASISDDVSVFLNP